MRAFDLTGTIHEEPTVKIVEIERVQEMPGWQMFMLTEQRVVKGNKVSGCLLPMDCAFSREEAAQKMRAKMEFVVEWAMPLERRAKIEAAIEKMLRGEFGDV